MAGKKGEIPEHVMQRQKKIFSLRVNHPAIKILSGVEDSRKPSLTFKYPLISILFITLMATICCANDWAKVVVMSLGMIDWLAQYVDMSAGVPCERTFLNIFNVIKPEALEETLKRQSTLIRENIPQEIVCLDGQTKRETAWHLKG